MNVEKFKEDHVAILQSVTQLRSLVQSGIAENSEAIARKIVAMSSAIKLHLTSEDRFLYPSLANSGNPDAARLAKQFQDEMGDLVAVYMEFAGKWNLATKVAEAPEEFKAHANSVFKALHQRIQRENTELYPMAEKVA